MEDLTGIFASEEEKEFVIEHDGKQYEFSLKQLTWSKKNKILSRAVQFDGKTITIDLDTYNKLVLKECLTKAPWPLAQTMIYLEKLGSSFGNKLQSHIPNPFEEEVTDPKNAEEQSESV